jgi:DNA invertase Pin-like site-specific DNA recombinase
MLIGYARVSTTDQNSDLQIDAYLKAGGNRRYIFEDQMSGMRADRPELTELTEALIPTAADAGYEINVFF